MGRALVKTAVAAAVAVATAVAVSPRRHRTGRVRELAEQLDSGGADERTDIAIRLVDEGLDVSASELLLLVRTDHDPTLVHAVARAVRDAPRVRRPSANVRELLQWSDAELAARERTR